MIPPEPDKGSAAEESSLPKCVAAATITCGMIIVRPPLQPRCLGPNNHGRFSRTTAPGPESWPASGLGCSTFMRVCFAIAAPAVVASLSLQLTSREPCIDLRLFKIFSFSMASVVRFLHSTGLHTYAFLTALFVQQTLGYTPFQAGLMMSRGRWSWGLRGCWWDVSPIRLSLGRFSPLNVSALCTLPEAHVAMGSGVLHVIMGIGAAVGTAGTASLLEYWTHLHRQVAGFQRIFLLISVLYLATVVLDP